MKRLLVLLALVTLALSPPALAGGGAGALRRPAPNFTFTDLGGEQVRLSDLRGQVVIVLFGDLGCTSCRENDLLLRQYQLQYLSHDLVVVSLHGRATLDELQRYDAEFAFSTLTGLDPGQQIARRYGAPLPTTVFIDRDGFVRDVRRGRLDEGQLVQVLRRLF